MKNLVLISCLFALVLNVNSQSKEELLENFVKSDWITVNDAKKGLENLEHEALTELIKLLDEDKEVKLTNTGDLIYPGAEKFYGHGQVIDYDIDNIAIRAGWLIEAISFNNFGFTGIHKQDYELLGFIKSTYPVYYIENSENIDSKSNEELREIIKKQSIQRAKLWWSLNRSSWRRISGLMNALRSDDEKRQAKALFYLRNGTTKCTGLDNQFYETDLHNVVSVLSKSNIKRVSEQAKLILDDTELYWLAIKHK